MIHKSLKMLQLLIQFLMTQRCRTFMIILWIVDPFEKHILQIWNIVCHCFNDRSLN